MSATKPKNGDVIVTCVERGHGALASARQEHGRRRCGLRLVRAAMASCTMGTEFAVKRAALKLLGGGESKLKAVCIEDNHALPRRTKWRVSR